LVEVQVEYPGQAPYGSQVQGKPRDPDGHHVGSRQGSTTGHSAPSSHRASGGVSRPVKHLGPPQYWSIPPNAFEEASTNTQSQDNSMVLPQVPQASALQSGETSNVVKEAELGNFHQQTEEFGYPAMGPVQGFPPVVLSPGVWGYPSPYPLPYPDFDYRLLYGLYPPGTYTTFSKEHEKGKDHYQTIHYLKEHGSDAPDAPQNTGSGQQKVFQGV
ncbi:hypothetical protein XENOCAPTIV_013807, partial [Xenoophorus captivus]